MKKLLILLSILLILSCTQANAIQVNCGCHYDVQYWKDAGTYTWTVPHTGIYWVVIKGAGAGGGGGAFSGGGGGKGGGEGQVVRAKMSFTQGHNTSIIIGAAGAPGLGGTSPGWAPMSQSGGATYVDGLAAGGGPQVHGGAPNNTAAAGGTGQGEGGGAGADGNGTAGADATSPGSGGGGGGAGQVPGSQDGGPGGLAADGYAIIEGPLNP